MILRRCSRHDGVKSALSWEVQLDAGRLGPLIPVIKNFHALRAALVTRTLDVDAQVDGCRTARYRGAVPAVPRDGRADGDGRARIAVESRLLEEVLINFCDSVSFSDLDADAVPDHEISELFSIDKNDPGRN